MSKKDVIEVVAQEQDAGKRLDAFLREHSKLTRSRIASLIKDGAVSINNVPERRVACRVEPDHIYSIIMPDVKATHIEGQNIPLQILYQDEDVVVIDKPCGMVVHPAAGNDDGTLVNALLFHVHDLSGIGGELRPGIVHRLDKDTSGVILVAKNDRAHVALSEQFKSRAIEKHYLAVVYGRFTDENGVIDAPIARHPYDRKRMSIVSGGKPSRTEWTVIEHMPIATLLDVHLLTGRTHQIRVHMKSVGHPLLGDTIYAPNLRLPVHVPRLMLHAKCIAFDHPSTGERMFFEAPMPFDFLCVLEKLKRSQD